MAELRARLAGSLRLAAEVDSRSKPGELVIYGAGNSGRIVAETAQQRGFTVRFFLDARAAEIADVGGVPCHLPASEAALSSAAEGTPVVVAVFNFAADLRPILETTARRWLQPHYYLLRNSRTLRLRARNSG